MNSQPIAARLLACAVALWAAASPAMGGVEAARPPLEIAKEGWLIVGGHPDPSRSDHAVIGQMYVEYQAPARQTHPYPVVMIHGSLQSGANFTGTPDGREGWAQYFLRHGYAVYIVDQPGRGRSAYSPDYGAQAYPSLKTTQDRFTAPERAKLWPQAHLHTQWPGAGVEGDPVFDGFFASELPSITDVREMQSLVRDAGAALLDRIGPAIIVVHSQAGLYPWSLAQVRPRLVRAIIAVEPSGPPVHDVQDVGAPDWFKDEPRIKPAGLGQLPLQYTPALRAGEQLEFEQATEATKPGLVRCWAQKGRPRKLTSLDAIPILMLTAEASYHAAFDDCTAAYLRQAGAQKLDHVHLADLGIHGNGHMMMLEKNSDEVAKVIIDWLDGEPWDRAVR